MNDGAQPTADPIKDGATGGAAPSPELCPTREPKPTNALIHELGNANGATTYSSDDPNAYDKATGTPTLGDNPRMDDPCGVTGTEMGIEVATDAGISVARADTNTRVDDEDVSNLAGSVSTSTDDDALSSNNIGGEVLAQVKARASTSSSPDFSTTAGAKPSLGATSDASNTTPPAASKI